MEKAQTKEESIREILLRRELDKIRYVNLNNITPMQALTFLNNMQNRLKEIDKKDYLKKFGIQ